MPIFPREKNNTSKAREKFYMVKLHILFLITVQEPCCLVTIFILCSALKMSQQPEAFL